MKVLKRIGILLCYVLLALVLCYQALGIAGVAISNVTAIQEATWLIPTWVTMVVCLVAAPVLYQVGKNKEGLPLFAMGAGILTAILALPIALTLQAALPMQVSASNISATGEQGLDAWKLITRHYSPMVVGLVVAVMGFVAHKQNRDARIYKEEHSYEEQFSLSDDEMAIGEQPKKSGKKLSKRQRKEQREKEESGM